jgi:hypothetical protein
MGRNVFFRFFCRAVFVWAEKVNSKDTCFAAEGVHLGTGLAGRGNAAVPSAQCPGVRAWAARAAAQANTEVARLSPLALRLAKQTL